MGFPRDKDFVKPFAVYAQLEENTHGIRRIFRIMRWVFFQFKVLVDQFDLHLLQKIPIFGIHDILRLKIIIDLFPAVRCFYCLKRESNGEEILYAKYSIG